MQVSQLIEMLGFMDPEAEVHFAYNYGDHWRTQVAPKVDSVGERVVEYSSYHSMDKIVEDDDDCYDEETGDYAEGVRKVVVLG
jgi:hypothetical protein